MKLLTSDQAQLRRIFPAAALTLVLAAVLMPSSAHAGDSGQQINFFLLTMNLFGGLAIFLYGMDKMSDSLKVVAGDRMKEVLGRLTTNRFMGVITGTFVTAVIQSSSVTTVLLVGFVTAGLMSLAQAVGVILGANIGTTITAQIIAFKVTKYAALMIAIGFIMIFSSKKERTKHYGHMVMGLGMIFFGMAVMSDAMQPLRSYQPFLELMQSVSNPLIGIVVGAAFTGLIQSSSATTGVILALSMQGLITLEAGIALILGANVGTCVTAGLAAIGKPREAVRVAVAHITFNVMGALLIVWFIPYFSELIRTISPAAPGLTGLDRLAQEVPRQVANAHTLFNIGMAVLFLPLAGLLARFSEKLVPDRQSVAGKEETAPVYKPRYLDDSLVSTPSLAVGMARRELQVMGDHLESILKQVPEAVFTGDLARMEAVRKLDDRVDAIHESVTRYLAQIGSHHLSGHVSDQVLAVATASSELETIGDIVENNLSHLSKVCANEHIVLSEEVKNSLNQYLEHVLEAVRSATTAVAQNDHQAAHRVMAMKAEISGMDINHQASQVKTMQQTPTQMDFAAYNLQVDIRENLKRIYYHAKRVAKLEAHVEDAAAWNTVDASILQGGALLPQELARLAR